MQLAARSTVKALILCFLLCTAIGSFAQATDSVLVARINFGGNGTAPTEPGWSSLSPWQSSINGGKYNNMSFSIQGNDSVSVQMYNNTNDHWGFQGTTNAHSGNQGFLSGDDSGQVPDNILRHYWFMQNDSATVGLTGSAIEDSKQYTVNMGGSRSTTGSRITSYHVGGLSKTSDAVNNTLDYVEFSGISPSGGEIYVSASNTNDQYGYLTWIEVWELNTSSSELSSPNPFVSFESSSGVTTVAGDKVQSWSSVEGNLTLSQSTDANRPLFVGSSMNGEPSLAFDGVNDFLRIPDLNGLNTGGPWDTKTLILAFQTGGDVSSRQIIYEQGGGTRGINLYLDNGEIYYNAWNKNEAAWGPVWVNTAVTPYTSYVATLSMDATAGTLTGYLNNQSVGTVGGVGTLYAHSDDGGMGNRFGGTLFHDGSSSNAYFYGKVAAWKSYNGLLTSSDQDSLEQAWMAKYNAGISLIPATPTSFALSNTSANEVTITWVDNADNESGFEIERSDDGGSTFTVLATVGANVIQYTDEGLSDGTYQYRVRAANSLNALYSQFTAVESVIIAPQNGFPPAGQIGILSPLAVGQVGSGFFPLQNSFDDQPTWDVENEIPTGSLGANDAPYYSNRYGYVDFGPTYADLRITETWTQYRTSSAGNQTPYVELWWDDDNDNVNDGVTEAQINFNSAQGINTGGSMPWIQDLDANATPITPQGRYLVLKAPPSMTNRAKEYAFVGYVYQEPVIDPTAFITTWKTDNPGTSSDTQIIISTSQYSAYDYQISWTEVGNPSNTGSAGPFTGDATIDFPNAGTYQVSIIGDFPRILFGNGGDNGKILSVDQWGDQVWTNFSSAFSGCSQMQINASDVPNLASVSRMDYAFAGASAFNQDINDWDVSSITDMGSMFRDAIAFNQPLNSWDVSGVTNMQAMFRGASSFNQDIDGWDVSSVTNIVRIFFGASAFNQPLNSWNLSSVTDLTEVFRGATSFDQPLNNWNVSNVTNMSLLFYEASSFNQNVNSWDVSNVTNMMSLFNRSTAFDQPLDQWDVSSVTDMNRMFLLAESFNQDLSAWDMGNVSNLERTFYLTSSLDQGLGAWDISNVTNMGEMLNGTALSAANYDATLQGWNTLDPGETQIPQGLALGASGLEYCDEGARNELVSNNAWSIVGDVAGANCPPDLMGDATTFITTWKTDNPGTSIDTQISIPTSGGGYNYSIEWVGVDDPSAFGGAGPFTGNATIDFPATGTYQVSISGDFPRIYFNNEHDKEKILSVDQWGDQVWTSMSEAFRGCVNISIVATDAPDLSSVTRMDYMFAEAVNMNQSINHWDLSNVIDLSSMFRNATAFNQPLNDWDVSNVTNLGAMFFGASAFNQPLDNWDVSQVTTLNQTFRDADAFNQNINGWNVGNVTNMYGTFRYNDSFNQPLGNWDVSQVTTMSYLFESASAFNQDLNSWQVGNVTQMLGMFIRSAFNQAIDSWEVSKVVTMESMFRYTPFNHDISSWNVSAVTNLQGMFFGAAVFDQDLGAWDISNVTNMGEMLNGTALSSANYDATLQGWNTLDPGETQIPQGLTLGVSGLEYCDEGARNELVNNNGWAITGDVAGSICPPDLMGDATTFITTWKTDNPGTSMDNQISIPTSGGGYNYSIEWVGIDDPSAFGVAGPFTGNTTIDFPSPGTYQVSISGDFPKIDFGNDGDKSKILSVDQWGDQMWISMANSFYGCDNVTVQATDVPDLSIVTNVSRMFDHASSMNQDLSSWDVSNVTNMFAMFNGASSFNGNISTWNVANVTQMHYMFNDASVFNQDLSNWDVGNVTTMSYMFKGAALFNSDISNWDISNVTSLARTFYGSSAFNQDLSSWNVGAVTDMSDLFRDASSFNANLESWDVSNVQNMFAMFFNASSFDQDLGNWDIGSVTNLGYFLVNSGLSSVNYTNSLDGWISSGSIPSNLGLDVGGLYYCSETSRNELINTYGWTISGDAPAGSGCESYLEPISNDPTAFITTWKTDNTGTSTDTQITIPTNGSGYNYNVTWQEVGNTSNNGTAGPFTGNATIDFPSAGTYQLSISGDFPRILFYNSGESEKLLSVEQWGINSWTNFNNAFNGCINLHINATDAPDLSGVTNLSKMFMGASSFNESIDHWDVSTITNMQELFHSAAAFNQPLSNWDVTNVTKMFRTFYQASSFNQPLDTWQVDNVTNMSNMFRGASSFNQELSSWNVGNVTNMSNMFRDASAFNGDIGSWDVSKVTNMSYLFNGASAFNQDLSSWQVDNVTTMRSMFYNTTFNQPLGNWNVGEVTNMQSMFFSNSVFNQDISSWDVSKVTTLQTMFKNATAFNQDISGWNVSSVTTMNQLFRGASAFNQDLSSWDITNITDAAYFFYFSGMSPVNYTRTLDGWSNLVTPPSNLIFQANQMEYCSETSRNELINTYGWTISGDAPAVTGCETYEDLTSFITTWKTDNPGTSTNTQITIPTTGSGYNYTVDWEEVGNASNNGSAGPFTGDATIDFPSAGSYQVSISGNFPRIYFNNGGDKDKILSVDQWGDQDWSSMERAFYGCSNLAIQAVDAPDLAAVTDMNHMFSYATSLNDDISWWDVSSVTNMSYMFTNASSFNQSVDNWDVSNVTDMSYMFLYASSFNQSLNSWNTSNVVDMEGMFQQAVSFNGDIGNWITSNLASMQSMFNNSAAFNRDIGGWDVSGVSNMGSVFNGANSFNQDVSPWNVSNVTTMSGMFKDATQFNQGIGSWDVSMVVTMNSMLEGASSFNQDIGAWNVSNVTSMNFMFRGASSFNQDIGTWNVGKVNSMNNMFEDASSFNQNIDSWNVSSVSSMNSMFKRATSFDQNLSSWDLASVNYLNYMFEDATSFNGEVSSWNTSNIYFMEGVFNGASSFDQNLGSWDIASVINISNMFTNTGIGTVNYDATLLGWSTLDPGETQIPQNLTLGADGLEYCDETARNALINDHGWTITGDALGDCTPEDAIVSYYKATNNTSDEIGGNNGVIIGSQSYTGDRRNPSGGAFYFDGSNAINVDGMIDDLASTSTGTWSFWAKLPDVTPDQHATFLMFGDENANRHLSLWLLSSGTFYFASHNFGNHHFIVETTSPALTDDEWFNLVVVQDGVQPKIYLNGVQQTTINTVGTNLSSWFHDSPPFDNARIGVLDQNGLTQTYFVGAIDDVVVYNRALTDIEIQDLYLTTSSVPFITTWKTDNPGTSSNTQIIIPTTGSGYNYTAEWEEVGNPSNAGTAGPFTGDATIDFPSAGMYQVSISGDFPRIYFNDSFSGDKQKIIAIDQWGDGQWISMNNAFAGCSNLMLVASDSPDLSQVVDMSLMFAYTSMFNGDIGSWDVSNVNNMSNLFNTATSFNQDISSWDVSSVTDMSSMFFYAESFNQSLDSWNVTNVQDMNRMFSFASSFNGDISSWDVSGVVDMSYMFSEAASFNQVLASWDVSSVTSMSSMFQRAVLFNQSLNTWDVSSVVDMDNVFKSASAFNQPLNNWDVSSVVNMAGMFSYSSLFNQPLNSWNVSNVQNMFAMFTSAYSFDQEIGAWDISNVVNASNILRNSGLSQSNYEATLQGWSSLGAGETQIPLNLTLDATGLEYCDEASRNTLINTYGWTITGDALGADCIVDPPVAPSSLTAAVSGYDVTLSWADNSDSETGFELERSEDGGSTFTNVATVAADVTNYTDESLVAGTYQYQIRAVDAANNLNSDYSALENATVENATPAETDGINRYIALDGNDDYIALNMSYNGVQAIPELTVEAWVRTSYSGGSYDDNWAIIDFDRSSYYSLYVRGDNGHVGFSTHAIDPESGGYLAPLDFDFAGTIDDMQGTTAINDGEWHHIAAVYDGMDKYIYVDGVLDATVLNPHEGAPLGSENPRFGIIGDGSTASTYNGGTSGDFFEGDISEVRVFEETRTEEQIQLYQEPSSIQTAQPGQVLGLLMDDYQGITSGTITDIVTNAVAGESFGPTYLQDTYYWVGDGGDWSDISHWVIASGSDISLGVVPSIYDDVIFDASSFGSDDQTVTITSSAYCKSMRWDGVTNTPYFDPDDYLTLAGSMYLSESMDIKSDAEFYFDHVANGSDLEVKTGGLQFTSMRLHGDGEWTVLDEVLNLTSGLFLFESTKLDILSTSINLSSIGLYNESELTTNNASITNVFNFRVDAGSTFLGGTSTLASNTNDGTKYFYLDGTVILDELSFLGSGGILRASEASPIKLLKVTPGKELRISGSIDVEALEVNGTCEASTYLRGVGEILTSDPTNLTSVEYVILENMSLTDPSDPAFTVVADYSIDLGGNSGWVFPTPTSTTYYWIGGGGDWSDGNHWSLNSNGVSVGCVPSIYDDVIFDASSFGSDDQTVTITSSAYCKSMRWDGVTNTPYFDPDDYLTLAGSMYLSESMDIKSDAEFYFDHVANGSDLEVKTGGLQFTSMRLHGDGEWTVLDEVLNLTSGLFLFESTKLDILSTSINLSSIGLYNESELTTNNASITNVFNFRVDAGSTFLGGTSTLASNTNDGTKYFYLDGTVILDELSFLGSGGILRASEASPIKLLKVTPGKELRISGSIDVEALNISGAPSGRTFLRGPATLNISRGNDCFEYLQVEDVTVTGATLTAGFESVDWGGNSGWVFDPATPCSLSAPTTFWAISAGDWSDPSIWSDSPGGPTINTVPSDQAEVHISGQVVTIAGTETSGELTLYSDNPSSASALLIQGILTVKGKVRLLNGATGLPAVLTTEPNAQLQIIETEE